MMRDEEVRTQLVAAIHARTDPALAKVLTKIDSSLVGCKDAAEQARKGMERLLQPAIIVPQ